MQCWFEQTCFTLLGMPKSSAWLDARSYLLIRILKDRYGLWMTLSRARLDIGEQLDRVSAERGISRSSARMFITKVFLEQMAAELAAQAESKPFKRPRHLTVLN